MHHLVFVVLKGKVEMCPEVGLVVVWEEGALLQVTYEPSYREVVCLCVCMYVCVYVCVLNLYM